MLFCARGIKHHRCDAASPSAPRDCCSTNFCPSRVEYTSRTDWTTPFLEGRLSVLVFLWAVTLFVFRNKVPLNGWIAASAAAAAWVSVFRYETAYLGNASYGLRDGLDW